MRTFLYRVLAFAVFGLVGPFIRLATWPPSEFQHATSPEVSSLVHNLVLDLWPVLFIFASSAEGREGLLVPGVQYPVAANVVLFGLVGSVVSAFAHKRKVIVFLYVAVCALLALFEFVMSGFNIAHMAWLPLIVAMGVWAVPFWFATR